MPTYNIRTALNHQNLRGDIFCSSAKAFDKILLGVLFCCHICGLDCQWFESHLLDRKQKVEIILLIQQQKYISSWGTIKCGVHQGSILRHLLFIMYINDLPLGIDTCCKPVLFASVLIIAHNMISNLNLHLY